MTDIVVTKNKAYEHRRQTILSDLHEAQARLHNDLAQLATGCEKINGKDLQDIHAGLEVNQQYIDLITHTYNPYTSQAQQLADAGTLENRHD